MAEHQASRTLVKSLPELWAECSNAASLERHLHAFGEIRITTLEPETAVAWEGERACGTVRIEPSGWGTRVTLTARALAAAEPKADARESQPPASPADCVFARTTTSISADLTTKITPCQFGGDPDCSSCGCLASAGLAAVARHRVQGVIPIEPLFTGSIKIGERMRRMRHLESQA